MKRKLIKGEKAYMNLPVEVKSIDKDMGTLEAIFSTQDVDRHGDIVLQEGWDLVNFKKNPVILNSHNYGDAAEVIGKASNVKIDGKKLTGKITFAVNENPKAKVIFDLYAGGFLNAFSVGFIPTKFKQNKDGSTDWFTIEEAELLEVSAVSVPANARALAKEKGIDMDVLPEHADEDEEKEEDEEEAPAGDPAPEEEKKDEVIPPADPAPEEEKKPDEPEAESVPDEPKVEEPVPPVQASYASKVVKAIASIESEERQALKRAAKIISSILNEDSEGKKLDEKVRTQIKQRKVNQAIRELMKTK